MAVALPGNNENKLLEELYIRKIRLDEEKDRKCQRVLTEVLKTVIDKAKEKSHDFIELFKEIYYGGSYYDNLKVRSTDFEFDLNIVFKIPKHTEWSLTNLGVDVRRPNFAHLQTKEHPHSGAWNKILCQDREGNLVVSPGKMFKILQSAVDRAITDIGNLVVVDMERYRVTRATGAPVILKVQGPGIKFTVDLVPAFKFELYHLKAASSEVNERVTHILTKFNIYVDNFMLIALKNASPDSLEVDFHDIERQLLAKRGGCVYTVIKLIKYLRDSKGGTMTRLWSHLLKIAGYKKKSSIYPKLHISDLSAASSYETRHCLLEQC